MTDQPLPPVKCPSEPPAARTASAIGAALVMVLGQVAEMWGVYILADLFASGKLTVVEFMSAAGFVYSGNIVGKARGKLGTGTVSLLIGAMSSGKGAAVAGGAAGARHFMSIVPVLLGLGLGLGVPGCNGQKPFVGWPDVTHCAPTVPEIVGDVTRILQTTLDKAEVEEKLLELARGLGKEGGDYVVCTVQHLLDRWLAPGAADHPRRRRGIENGQWFLEKAGAKIGAAWMEDDMGKMFALITVTPEVTKPDLHKLASALEVNAAHCAAAWGHERPAIEVYDREAALPDGCYPIVFQDEQRRPGVLAEHGWDPARHGPYARVFVSVASGFNAGPYSVCEAAGHEVLEADVNPRLTSWAPHPTRAAIWVPKEVCDPPQDTYSFYVGGTPWQLANFVTPAWYDPAFNDPELARRFMNAGGRFDYMQRMTYPGQILPEGYSVFRDGRDGRTWTEGAFGAMPPAKTIDAERARSHPWARTQRLLGQQAQAAA